MSCTICGNTKNLVSHHKSYDPEIIEVLCKSCHKTVHYHTDVPKNPNARPFEGKTVRIDEKIYSELVAYAAYMTLDLKRKVNLSEAIDLLLDKASHVEYKKALKGEHK